MVYGVAIDRPAMGKTAIDLFCGSGAVTWGLKHAGFRVTAALDTDQTACATYRLNHPEVALFETDIKTADISEFQEACPEELSVLAICAPCQPFSSQNRKRRSADSRTELIISSLPFVEAFRPAMIFLENVPRFGKEGIVGEFSSELLHLGYSIGPVAKVDAARLGVAQRRQRVMLVATDERRCHWQQAYEIKEKTPRTVADAIQGLPQPAIGRTDNLVDPLHYSRRHHALTLERLRHIPKNGGGRDSLPEVLRLNCHKAVETGSFPDTYGRMKWEDVAPTLTTGCTDLTRGRYVHPEHDRAITLREAARLQSFPDEYQFAGNATQIAAQIGNAVPPLMMAAIAEALASAITAS